MVRSVESGDRVCAARRDALILVAPDWKVAVAAWMARIPRRVGRLQRLTDFLFLNRSQRQRRSEVAKHEAEYNLDLVEWLLEKPVPSQIGSKIVVSASDRKSALAILDRLKVKAPFWVVHPGMGGSALNWPPRSYASLIEGMLDRGLRVVVSSGPQDQLQAFEVERWLSPEARKSDRLHWYRAHRELGSVGVLAGVLEASAGVVAPSTGPLHMAVALGKRVVSVYPPVKVQSSKRWGPFRAKSAAVFTPNVTCPGKMGCLEDACELHPCMERLTGPQLLEQIAPNEVAGVGPNRTITTSA
jgi:ADP-heptose:LPS heptosyltransferase